MHQASNYRKNKGFKGLGNYSEWPKVAGAVIKALFLIVDEGCLRTIVSPRGLYTRISYFPEPRHYFPVLRAEKRLLQGSRPILVTSGEAWYLPYCNTEETRTAMP